MILFNKPINFHGEYYRPTVSAPLTNGNQILNPLKFDIDIINTNFGK